VKRLRSAGMGSTRAEIGVRAPRAYQAPGRLAGIRRAARAVLQDHGLEGKATLTVVLTDEESIRALNPGTSGRDPAGRPGGPSGPWPGGEGDADRGPHR